MKKIIVIGCPGSGKSTFSRALSEKTGIPLYHLDMMYWNEDRTTVEKSIFLERLRAVISEDGWIIDGNYASTLEMRLEACDTIFFLDIPAELCLEGVRERLGRKRDDMPWVETEEDEEFAEYIRAFSREQRPKIQELLGKCGDKRVITFVSREQIDEYLKG